MDELDLQIIQKLQQNARLSLKQIAKILKTPASTIHFRVQKLIEGEIISKFSCVVDIEKLGYETVGWANLIVDPLKADEIANKIASFEQVRMISATGGPYNLIIQIISKNEKELWNFIQEHIQTIDGVQKLDVSSSLKIYKWDTCYYFNLPKSTAN